MIPASLQELARTGAFGPLELGVSRATVEQHLGPPDCWHSRAPTFTTATIWKYGSIEFYFHADTLDMIFTDDLEGLSGGQKLELDAWVCSDSLTVAAAAQHLAQAGIPYRQEDFPYNENGVHLITSAGTVLSFSGPTAARATLQSICRSTAVGGEIAQRNL